MNDDNARRLVIKAGGDNPEQDAADIAAGLINALYEVVELLLSLEPALLPKVAAVVQATEKRLSTAGSDERRLLEVKLRGLRLLMGEDRS